MTSHPCKAIMRIFSWRGRLIQVRYEPRQMGGDSIAHLTIRSLQPPRGPLPVTETGYRSHFADPETIDDAGGPVAFVRDWLNEASSGKRWRAAEEASRQLSLF